MKNYQFTAMSDDLVYQPVVSVILPVYDGEKYLSDAVASILNQDFSDFELIAIDDGSRDGTLAILRQWQVRDPRIRIISRKNRGLVATLNEAISLAKGRYIARMDADDISFPDRLRRQVEYLECNTDVVLLGVSVTKSLWFKSKLPKMFGKGPTTWGLVFRNNVGHPGVMLRVCTLRDNNLHYRSEYKHAEDFKLWCEMIRFGRADVLPRSLLYYRTHPESVSAKNRRAQALIDRRIVMENMREKFDIDMEDCFYFDVRTWINKLTERLFLGQSFANLPFEDQNSIIQTYQEYCAGFGFQVLWHYVQVIGTQKFLATGLRVPICLYRAAKGQMKKEWARLEI